ncbi:uncharacterized protein BYT42DRAFT_213887, partial [Radiomyces spectabilis]|uniref:uncharacterized protein n=1 Tax=Radiomyces spectabilis TaxID=64574 RepID=UPI00222026B4
NEVTGAPYQEKSSLKPGGGTGGAKSGAYLVEAVPSVDILSAEKRRRVEDQEPSKTVVKTSKTAVQPRKSRNPPRTLEIDLIPKKIWDKLQHTDAGLTMADWLYLERQAGNDIAAGIRYWRRRKPAKENSMQVNNLEVLSDSEDSLDLGSQASSETESDVLEWEKDMEWESDTDSVDTNDMTYPYDLSKMRVGSPLKGKISINGHEVEAVFDTGASVSVIGKDLSDRLGLATNGDQMHLSGFNIGNKDPSDITTDVPICVAGKIRPEHMCVQTTKGKKDLCLLGISWFHAHGIEISLQDNTLRIPCKKGVVILRCHTEYSGAARNNDEVEAYALSVCPTSSDVFNVENDLEDRLVPYLNDVTEQEGVSD